MPGRIEPENRTLRVWLADLYAVTVGSILLPIAVLAPIIAETPLRLVIVVPFVLFGPGYALISALYPRRRVVAGDGKKDGIERIALSLGGSLAIVPFVGIGLAATPWGIQIVPLTLSLATLTLLLSAIAAYRRNILAPSERFQPPFDRWYAKTQAGFDRSHSRSEIVLNIVVVLSILLAIISVGYALAEPRQEEPDTAFSLMTQTNDGQYIAGNYPSEFVVDEPQSLYVSIQNSEHEPVTYTVVVQLQRIEIQDSTVTVQEREELDRTTIQVADGETVRFQNEVEATMTGTDLRLVYLLYQDGVPATPTTDNAYMSLDLQINVAENSADGDDDNGSEIDIREPINDQYLTASMSCYFLC